MTPRHDDRPGLLALLAACLLLACLRAAPPARAGDPPAEPTLLQRTLPLRTALHHDPTLATPLDRLLAAWRDAGRLADLLDLYRTHLQRYPTDLSARTVYVRLLHATHDPAAEREARDAVARHPDDAWLRYVLYQILDERADPGALDALDAAVRRAHDPSRRRRWIDRLLELARREDRRDLALEHLRSLPELLGGDGRAHLETARRMQDLGFSKEALAELETARGASPDPETGVEIELLGAKVEVALGRRAQAAARLDALLGRLTADYWRRPEILRRRARLVASARERDALLAAARKRVEAAPQDETAALDLARLLSGFERNREALEVLRTAGERLPVSASIEAATLALFDRLHDDAGRLAWLDARLARTPARQDLQEQRVRTLLRLGRTRRALARLDEMLAPLPADVRLQRLLETARAVRDLGRYDTAADLYGRVVAMDPARLDVRREQVECDLARGDGAAARRVLSAPLPPDAPRDAFLDLVQLLTSRDLWSQARRLLGRRAHAHPQDLDVLLLLARAEGNEGHAARAADRLVAARALADTAARYRLWLQAGLDLHRMQEDEGAFLDGEQARLGAERGTWTPARLGRAEAFAEVCAESGHAAPVIALLRTWLADRDLPADARVRLRRRLASLLEAETHHGGATEAVAGRSAAVRALEGLLHDDPAHADAYRARLALLHLDAKRTDLARPLLAHVDVRRLREAHLLERLVHAWGDLGDGAHVLATLERLTAVAPTERTWWQRWIEALTASGDEARLRGALRTLLRGVAHMPLALATRQALQAHLLDSYGRSVGEELAAGTEAGRLEALALLDEAQRAAPVDALPPWIAWTRAWALRALGRTAARDEALAELDRLVHAREEAARKRAAAQPSAGQSDAQDEDPARRLERALRAARRVDFPDGVGAAWPATRALLAGAPPAPARQPAVADRDGPDGPLRARWTFETDDDVLAVRPLGPSRLLVADLDGTLYALDRATGKLLWERVRAYAPVAPPQGGRWPARARPPLVLEGGLVLLPRAGSLLCLDADGRRRWVAEVGVQDASAATVEVAAGAGAVYVCEPVSGEVAALHPDDGRRLWDVTLDPPGSAGASGDGCGLVLGPGGLLVHGPRTAVLDPADGAVRWTFDATSVRRVPLRLREPRPALGSPPATAAGLSASRRAPAPPGMGPTWGSVPPFAGTGPVIWGAGPPGRVAYVYPYPGRGFPGYPVPATPAPVFVPAPGRSASTWSPQDAGGRSVAVVAPAVRWAAPLSRGEERLALWSAGRLLLLRGSGVGGRTLSEVVRVDLALPGAGTTAHLAGTPVASWRGRLALLREGHLVLWDAASGRETEVALQGVDAARTDVPLATAPAGAWLYLAGPGGVLCVHQGTGRLVLQAAWPAAVAWSPPAKRQPTNRVLRGVAWRSPTGAVVVRPEAGFVDARALYVPGPAGRLVALEHAPAKEHR